MIATNRFQGTVEILRKLEGIKRTSDLATDAAREGISTPEEFRDFFYRQTRLRSPRSKMMQEVAHAFGIPIGWHYKSRTTRPSPDKEKAIRLGRKLVKLFKPFDYALTVRAGVYALMQSGRIMYVGQSINVFRRIGDHLETKDPFDEVRWIPVPGASISKLLRLEFCLISHLNPPWNNPGSAFT